MKNQEVTPTGSFYEQKHDETEKRILKGAKQLLLSEGFADVSMANIANKTGLSRQRLYLYFPSLDAIIYRIQNDDMQAFVAYFSSTLSEKSLSPTERLFQTVKTIFDYQEKHPEDFLFTSDFDVFYRLHKTSPELREKYANSFKGYGFAETLHDLFIEGIASKEMNEEINPDGATAFWANSIQMLCYRLSFLGSNGEEHSKQECDEIKETFLLALHRFIRR